MKTCIRDGCGTPFDSTEPETRATETLRAFYFRYCPKHRIRPDHESNPVITETKPTSTPGQSESRTGKGEPMKAQTAPNGFANPAPEVDASGITAQAFADSYFESSYCTESHGDIEDHYFVIGPFGGWFAYCKNEPSDD